MVCLSSWYILSQLRGIFLINNIDSQAAIKAINKYTIKSKLVAETKVKLNEVCKNNKVILKLKRIPSHVGKESKLKQELH